VPWLRLVAGRKRGQERGCGCVASFFWQRIQIHRSTGDKIVAAMNEDVASRVTCTPGWVLQVINGNGCQTIQPFVKQKGIWQSVFYRPTTPIQV